MIIFVTILILLVIFVNGWTDAPNAIAGCVSTRSSSPSTALLIAALCNFSGAVLMFFLSPRVAATLYNIVDLGGDSHDSLIALSAGLLSVIIWATVAFFLGLPTSESHAMISGISGAAIAKCGSLSALNIREWSYVLCGLFATTLPPFILGYLFYRIVCLFLKRANRRGAILYFSRAQKLSAASSAFLHGAQDSQKFMGVYLLALSLFGINITDNKISILLIFICAAIMTLGTMLGGTKIIKKVGCDMTDLDASGGSAADAASSAVLLVCSLLGIPASTTHSKTCAIMGTGLCKSGGVDLRIALQMFGAWGLTFPVCGVLGYIFYRLMSALF